MKVICSGMPKTGTKTICQALRTLGYNVYDFEEQFWYLGDQLKKVLDEGWTNEEMRDLFEGVDAVTDVPGCTLWEEILTAYPDAKIVHMERESDEEWGKSFDKQMKTIRGNIFMRILVLLSPTGRKLRQFFNTTLRCQASNMHFSPLFNRPVNVSFAKTRYREHNANVRQSAPKDQILFFKHSDGWDPLCKFLGQPVPSTPYPHRNKGGEIVEELVAESYVFVQIKKEVQMSLAAFVLAIGLIVYMFML
uniref:Sulfotransferase n=1 Tax=Ciona savignyi TaxID=51511 RepID=H2ZBR0_CIOSA